MMNLKTSLVGGLEHFFIFPYIGNVIIPTDELIFFREVGIPLSGNFARFGFQRCQASLTSALTSPANVYLKPQVILQSFC